MHAFCLTEGLTEIHAIYLHDFDELEEIFFSVFGFIVCQDLGSTPEIYCFSSSQSLYMYFIVCSFNNELLIDILREGFGVALNEWPFLMISMSYFFVFLSFASAC
jgi:hypothetical protein